MAGDDPRSAGPHLGDTYRATGSAESAAAVWRQALAIFEELGGPDADEIRRKLEGIA